MSPLFGLDILLSTQAREAIWNLGITNILLHVKCMLVIFIFLFNICFVENKPQFALLITFFPTNLKSINIDKWNPPNQIKDTAGYLWLFMVIYDRHALLY